MNKILKLKKNYEFKNVLTRGKCYSGNCLNVFIKRNNFNTNYIGIAISVKFAKAVKRNRIKRLISENYRLLEKNLKKGYNIVFLWKRNVDFYNANFYNIKNDMINIFKKAGLLEE